MPISNRDAKRIFSAITAADGYTADVTVDGKTRLVNKQYQIPAGGRIVLARNHALLQPIVTGLSKAHDALIRELSGNDEATALPPELNGEFTKRWEALLDEDVDVELIRCKQKVLLDAAACDLPPTLISGLIPLINDMD